MSAIHQTATIGDKKTYYSSDVVPGSEFQFNVTRFPGTESERLVKVTVFKVVGQVTKDGESLGKPSWGYDVAAVYGGDVVGGISSRAAAIAEAAAVAVEGPGIRYRVQFSS